MLPITQETTRLTLKTRRFILSISVFGEKSPAYSLFMNRLAFWSFVKQAGEKGFGRKGDEVFGAFSDTDIQNGN